MNSSRIYSLLAVLVIFAILLLGWLGAIWPQLTQITDTEEQISSVTAQNDVLAQTLATLKTESGRLPELTDQLDALRTQIPESAQVDSFVREVQSLAEANGVEVTNLTVPEAVAYPAAGASATPTTTATTTPTPVPTDSATPAPTTSASPSTGSTAGSSTDLQPSAALSANLYTLNFTLSISGSGDAMLAFLNAVQKGDRLFLVTTVSLNTQAPDALGTSTIGGYIFIVSSPASRAAAPSSTSTSTPTATPTPTPTPTSTPVATPTPTETPAG